MSERIHFVTGRLAEHSLRAVLADLGPRAGFEYTVDVLGITVAALLTTAWVAPRIQVPPGTTRVILPGYCQGDPQLVVDAAGVPVELGPRDLRRLPEYFGQRRTAEDYGAYDIEILAEINHAPRLALPDILAEAARLQESGADLIDIGCEPGDVWTGVEDCVRALVGAGHRVSIDSMNPAEIAPAVAAGAELVLSVNRENRNAALDWGCEVVVVPDDPSNLNSLEETLEFLATRGVRLRIDPILEPIGFGFAASLGRYLEARRRYPDAEMLMGIGNLTELTDADSAAINVLLMGFCEELGIRSILTTQVINWARTSVRECDLARRLVYYAHQHRTLPKRVEPRLVMLRDPQVLEYSLAELDALASQIKDANYRLFAAGGQLHALAAGRRASDTDPFRLFEQLNKEATRPLDASHAFYLGYELAKAHTALTLGKEYRQDEALDWGFLTASEQFHRLSRHGQRAEPQSPPRRSSCKLMPSSRCAVVEPYDPQVDLEVAFQRLAARPHVVFFDSARRHNTLGRYSFLACDPFEYLAVPADGSDGLRELERRLARFSSEPIAGLPPFQGGAAGLFSYDLNRSLERIPPAAIDEFQVPALAVGLYDVLLAVDHVDGKAWIISQGFPETDPAARHGRARERLHQFRHWLEDSTPHAQPMSLVARIPPTELAPQFPVPGPDGLTSNLSAERYLTAIRRAIEYIYAGDVFQVNIAQRLLYPAHGSPVDLYLRLRRRNPATFAGYFDLGQTQIVSASPERFLRVVDGRVEARPIKGTRSRIARPEADLFSGDELLGSEKDRAENVMIVDLLRNDLSQVCTPESVRVTELCRLETYEFVQHLVSAVEGTLAPERTVLDLVRAAFPGGSITGAPKVRAMEIIAELEPTARGAYCGSLGYLGFDGTLDTSILIRTFTASGGWWQAPVGGGIVAQSVPAREYEETWHKATGLIRALQ